MEELSIDIKNLSKTFSFHEKETSIIKKLGSLVTTPKRNRVLSDINLQINKGEVIGIIGKNGSGKSTLLKLILGVLEPDEGSKMVTEGKILRLALGLGFDMNLTARDNIYVNGAILGLSFKQIGKAFNDIISFAEIEKFVDTPLKFFSSGMRSRLSFAIAIHAEADIYLIDEFFGDVGDEIFKQKSQKAFETNLLSGKTILLVSHSLETIYELSDRVFVLKEGSGRMFEDVDGAIEWYLN